MGDTTLADQFPQLPHSSIQVHDFFDDTGWNIDRLIQIVPLTIAEQIGSIPITPHVDDQIVWTDTSDGRFVTKSAWQLVGGQVLCPPPVYSFELFIYGWGFLNPPPVLP
ncbi:Retrotransposon [Abeliophyllum distichum]|uniref:Retrotransposon n=1 Tax=Abeliophyllum distichum TaxID=126358 RepID=A0ABD1NNZ2_9LAMI